MMFPSFMINGLALTVINKPVPSVLFSCKRFRSFFRNVSGFCRNVFGDDENVSNDKPCQQPMTVLLGFVTP